ncbi:hypothetical protein MKW92_026078 [Papaver armeniacum]|nr:hypothetical protein MKW92_026078 [Papaver armeniacum]
MIRLLPKESLANCKVSLKFRLRVEDVKRKNVLTNLWGMDFTTYKLRSLVRKWTIDNFTSMTFCIRFTKQREKQVKRTCYAQSSRIREVKLCISISTFS